MMHTVPIEGLWHSSSQFMSVTHLWLALQCPVTSFEAQVGEKRPKTKVMGMKMGKFDVR